MSTQTKFPIEDLAISNFFINPKLDIDLGSISKDGFVQTKRIKISELHPNQEDVNGAALNLKMKGKHFTTPYVVLTAQGNILIDGHHTVIVKKLKGQLFIYAKCYSLS